MYVLTEEKITSPLGKICKSSAPSTVNAKLGPLDNHLINLFYRRNQVKTSKLRLAEWKLECWNDERGGVEERKNDVQYRLANKCVCFA